MPQRHKLNTNIYSKRSNTSSASPDEPYKTYFTTKQIAKVLEISNDSRIIAFPSVPNKNGQIEWYKIGGNSAYYYKYIVAPRLNKKPPTIHPDTDLNHRFKDGVIAINNHKAFIENLTRLGYKHQSESSLIIFDLNHTFSVSEIRSLKNRENADKTRLNKLFRPQYSKPEIYILIVELSKIIPVKAKNLKHGFHDDFAPELNHTVIELCKTYHRYANGRLDAKVAKQYLLGGIDDLTAILSVLSENDCLSITDRIRLGKLISKLKDNIDRNIHE